MFGRLCAVAAPWKPNGPVPSLACAGLALALGCGRVSVGAILTCLLPLASSSSHAPRRLDIYPATKGAVYSIINSNMSNLVPGRDPDPVARELTEPMGILRMRGLPFSATKRDVINFFQGFDLPEHRIVFVPDPVRGLKRRRSCGGMNKVEIRGGLGGRGWWRTSGTRMRTQIIRRLQPSAPMLAVLSGLPRNVRRIVAAFLTPPTPTPLCVPLLRAGVRQARRSFCSSRRRTRGAL